MNKHYLSLFIGAILCGVLIYFGKPWIGLVALAGPSMALAFTIAGVSGAAIFTWLSGKGSLPIVAVVGFLITAFLAAYSFLVE